MKKLVNWQAKELIMEKWLQKWVECGGPSRMEPKINHPAHKIWIQDFLERGGYCI